jgi:hypothetical protein
MVAFLTEPLQALRSRFARRARLEAENLLLRAASKTSWPRAPAESRPLNVDLALPTDSSTVGRYLDRAAGDSAALASSWFPGVLALAFAQPRWPSQKSTLSFEH